MSKVATKNLELRVKYSQSNLDWVPHRLSNYGAFQCALADTVSDNKLINESEITKIKNSTADVKVPVLDKIDFSFGTSDTCTFTELDSDSAQVTVVFTELQWGFSMIPFEKDVNDIEYDEELQKKLISADRDFNKVLDTAVVAVAETNKSQVLTSTFLGAGNKYGDYITADEITVTNAQSSTFLNDLSSIMLENDFKPRYNVIANTAYTSQLNFDRAQGPANSVNTSFQFGEYDFFFTNNLDPGASNDHALYCSPFGTYSIFNRNSPHYTSGYLATEGTQWSTTQMPTSGWSVGVKFKSGCADKSAIYGGTERTLAGTPLEQWSFHTQYAIVVPYVADPATEAFPIVKAVITTA